MDVPYAHGGLVVNASELGSPCPIRKKPPHWDKIKATSFLRKQQSISF